MLSLRGPTLKPKKKFGQITTKILAGTRMKLASLLPLLINSDLDKMLRVAIIVVLVCFKV